MKTKPEKGKPGRPKGVSKTSSRLEDADVKAEIEKLKKLWEVISLSGKTGEDLKRAKQQLIWQYYRRNIIYKAGYDFYIKRPKRAIHIKFTWGVSRLVNPKEDYLPKDVSIEIKKFAISDIENLSFPKERSVKVIEEIQKKSKQGRASVFTGVIIFNRHTRMEDFLKEAIAQLKPLLLKPRKLITKHSYFDNMLISHLVYNLGIEKKLSKKEVLEVLRTFKGVSVYDYSRLVKKNRTALRIIKESPSPFLNF